MATIKNAAELKNSAKETRATIGAKNTAEKLKQVASKGSINLKPELTRLVDLSKGVRVSLKSGCFVDFSAKDKNTIFNFDLHGLSRDEARLMFADLNERLRNIDASFKMKLKVGGERIFGHLKEIESGQDSTGLYLDISPAGGVDCSYKINGEGTYSYRLLKKKTLIVGTSIGTRSSKASSFERIGDKYKNWEVLHSEEDVYLKFGRGTIFNDANVKEGTKYSYCLELKKKGDKIASYYEKEILYNNLKIVGSFTAKPDPIEKKVCLCNEMKNYVDVKIVRVDNGCDLTLSLEDKNVEFGGMYEYLLTATNVWDTKRVYAKASCANTKPKVNNVAFKLDAVEKGGTLDWKFATSFDQDAVERRLKGGSWVEIRKKQLKQGQSYKDVDSALKKDQEYEYRVRCCNGWGDSYSDPVPVVMKGDVPKKPRILPPQNGETMKWTRTENVKNYVVERYDYADSLDFNKIDEGTEKSSKRWSGIANSSNYLIDSEIGKNVKYLYKIVAQNGWGDSLPLYYDVVLKDDPKGRDEPCYEYAKQNKMRRYWNINFQGITTDGNRWYITNGIDKYSPSLRWAPVNKTLDRKIDCDTPIPDPDHTHVGDLDCYGDYLFVAVYKTNDCVGDPKDKRYYGQIWIYDKNTMERITTVKLYLNDGTPLHNPAWCAINPCDKRLYTSTSYVYGKIYSFAVNFDAIGKPGADIFPKATCRELMLYGAPDENGFEQSFTKESMQGGCFDYYNNLYLSSGLDGSKVNEGIHVFKLVCDEKQEITDALGLAVNDSARAQVYESYISRDWSRPCVCSKAVLLAASKQDHGFRYQFNSKNDQEPEGFVYFDFNYGLVPPQNYIKNGSFHAGLLLNYDSQPTEEDLCFKHYAHLYRETESRNVYYDPQNLSVVNVSADSFKVVDNAVLVGKFTTAQSANLAIKVLNNFKQIKTIGWLKTSSPNHNYEFSALEWNGSSLLQKEGLTTEGNSADCHVIEFDANSMKYPLVRERYVVYFDGYDKKKKQRCTYHFCAHNEADAKKIYETLSNFKKICIIGAGPDTETKSYFDENGVDYGYRIRSENNLIWLEN